MLPSFAIQVSTEIKADSKAPISGLIPIYESGAKFTKVSGTGPGSIWLDRSTTKKFVPVSMQGELSERLKLVSPSTNKGSVYKLLMPIGISIFE